MNEDNNETRWNVTTRHDGRAQRNRLKGAALTLLAAACAAVLLFGHVAAQGINPDPPREPILLPKKGISITHMGSYDPQTPNAVEWQPHTAYVITDRPFSRVDWYVDGAFKHTSRPSGASQTSSYFSHSYKDGSTTGVEAVVKAVAYPRFHDPKLWTGDSKEMTITVWEAISTMLYLPRGSVEGESIEIGLWTSVPFDRVEYAIEGVKDKKVDRSNATADTWSETKHTFNSGGDKDGNARTVTAVAEYVTPTGFVVKSRPETQSVKLYAGNGYIWKRTCAKVVSFSAADAEHKYELTTWHHVNYYNDTGKNPNDTMKTRNAWREGDEQKKTVLEQDEAEDEKGVPVLREYDLTETLAYDASMSFYRHRLKTLKKGKWYGGHAYTNLHSDGAAQCKAESSPEALEYDDEKQLPAGDSVWKKNSNAEFLLK